MLEKLLETATAAATTATASVSASSTATTATTATTASTRTSRRNEEAEMQGNDKNNTVCSCLFLQTQFLGFPKLNVISPS